MAKKYEGGWGIRVRKNIIENANINDAYIWLNNKRKLDSIENVKRYVSRDEAYYAVNNDFGDLEIVIDPNENTVIDCCDFAVDKLPMKPITLVNPNPDRPWDIVFDRAVPPPYEPDEPDYDDDCFPPTTPMMPGFTYKKVDPKSKDGKKLLELICKLFGI